MRPVDITPENANKLWQRIYGSTILQTPPKANFLENDAVRIALEKPVFCKGYFPTFSDEIFRIHRAIVEIDLLHIITYVIIRARSLRGDFMLRISLEQEKMLKQRTELKRFYKKSEIEMES